MSRPSASLVLLVLVAVSCRKAPPGRTSVAAQTSRMFIAADHWLAPVDGWSYDFGDVDAGTLVEHEFLFCNVAGSPVHIRDVSADCGCHKYSHTEGILEPGKSGFLRVAVQAGGTSRTLGARFHVVGSAPGARSEYLGTFELRARVRNVVSAYLVPEQIDLGRTVSSALPCLRAELVIAAEAAVESPKAVTARTRSGHDVTLGSVELPLPKVHGNERRRIVLEIELPQDLPIGPLAAHDLVLSVVGDGYELEPRCALEGEIVASAQDLAQPYVFLGPVESGSIHRVELSALEMELTSASTTPGGRASLDLQTFGKVLVVHLRHAPIGLFQERILLWSGERMAGSLDLAGAVH